MSDADEFEEHKLKGSTWLAQAAKAWAVAILSRYLQGESFDEKSRALLQNALATGYANGYAARAAEDHRCNDKAVTH